MTDFFGSQRPVELMDALLQDYNLTTPPDGGARGVGSTAEVQTAEEPKTLSTGQQAKQLDEQDHLVSETLPVWHSILRVYTHVHLLSDAGVCQCSLTVSMWLPSEAANFAP